MEESLRLALISKREISLDEFHVDKKGFFNFQAHFKNFQLTGFFKQCFFLSVLIGTSFLVSFFGNFPAITSFICIAWFIWFIYPLERDLKFRRIFTYELSILFESISRHVSSGRSIAKAFLVAQKDLPNNNHLSRPLKGVSDFLYSDISMGISSNYLSSNYLISDNFAECLNSNYLSSHKKQPELMLAIRILNYAIRRGDVKALSFLEASEYFRQMQFALERTDREVATITHMFWILAILAGLASIFLLMVNPEYCERAFDDVFGQTVFEVGISATIFCLVWFRSITAKR